MANILFKKINPNCIFPLRATDGSSGWDLAIPNGEFEIKQLERPVPAGKVFGWTNEEGKQKWSYTFLPGERILVNLGFAVALPQGYEWQIRGRSGLSSKRGLMLCNGVGTIDSDFRGILHIPLFNSSAMAQTITSGERIAQAILSRYEVQEFFEVDELSETDRTGGFGSSGI